MTKVATRRCFIERGVQFEEYQLHDTPPTTHEGITISPPIFDDDEDVLQVSDSDEEYHIQHDLVIETKYQEIPDIDPVHIPNQKHKPRWDQNLIDAAGYGARNTEDKRRIRSQYQNEHAALSLTDLITIEWCSKIP